MKLTVTTAGSTLGFAADAALVPTAPTLTETAGGSIGATTYYARVAYTDADHAVIGSLSAEASLAVDANNLLVVHSPSAHSGAVGWIPYVATTADEELAQVTTPIAIGTNWTEPTGGLISGTAVPGSDSTALNPPAAPTLSEVLSGALAGTTYYTKTTYLNPLGETLPSDEASLAVDVNNVLKVASPAAYADATHYNVYVSETTGTETLQNVAPILLGTDWQEPDSGLVSGAPLPVADTTHLLPPAAATLSSVLAGDTKPGETCFVRVTYLNPLGETLASTEDSLAVPANSLLKITSPAAYANADHWNAYVANEAGLEVLQNASPIALGTDWTEPLSGLISGGQVVDATLIARIPNAVGVYELMWPCFNGISVVPGTDQVVSVSYE